MDYICLSTTLNQPHKWLVPKYFKTVSHAYISLHIDCAELNSAPVLLCVQHALWEEYVLRDVYYNGSRHVNHVYRIAKESGKWDKLRWVLKTNWWYLETWININRIRDLVALKLVENTTNVFKNLPQLARVCTFNYRCVTTMTTNTYFLTLSTCRLAKRTCTTFSWKITVNILRTVFVLESYVQGIN